MSERRPVFDFVAFLLIFGWEGPFGIYIGVAEENYGLVLVGLLITIFFWGWFGIWELIDFIKYLVSDKKAK